ncbi:hypothetical protein ACFXD5_37640 [Streptomyces sp. NPDC059385]|uniref:hypothetical protein n=1 Tax=Streptomyces sp. NPDC059385 TaxID=3346817 RepID=UPI0036900505
MGRSGHARSAVWAAAAVLLVAPALAGTASAAEAGAAVPPSVGAAAVPAADGPADPAAAKAQIEKNWAVFFDPKSSSEEKAAVLEHGDFLEPLLGGLAKLPKADKVSVKVTNVTFTSPTQATVTYDLLVSGTPAMSANKGIAVLDDGVWKVSLKSLCGLIELSGESAPAPC